MSAVVIGASIAGLLAARVLSEHGEVILLDHDELPHSPTPRRGVPQSKHVHGLLASGAEALEELFPGLTASLVAESATDVRNEMHWYINGRLLPSQRSPYPAVTVDRDHLEYAIRRRVLSSPSVELRTGVTVDGIPADADLVVDASGRTSRLPRWLAELGYPEPVEERADLGVTYVSQRFRRDPADLGGLAATAITARPENPRGGFITVISDDVFLISMAGRYGQTPPTDHAGMLAFAESFDAADIADVIRRREPLGPPALMRFPRNRRVHYEHIPGNLLVVGDALASLNPVFGQGMTVAALEAKLLRRLLKSGTDTLSARYFAEVATIVDRAWEVSYSEDTRFPQSAAYRDDERTRYLGRLRDRLADDAILARAFGRVTNLVDPMSALFTPDIRARVSW
jgi:2-polyprenyl-6-methoxyphenol hydroxylase-like FAD-dependent oxidoreductase